MWIRIFEVTVTFTSFALPKFSEAKTCTTKKAVSLRTHPASQQIFTRVYFVHIYQYMLYAKIGSIWILRALQVFCPDPWALIRVHHEQCVCAYTSHTLPNPSKEKQIHTKPLFLLMSLSGLHTWTITHELTVTPDHTEANETKMLQLYMRLVIPDTRPTLWWVLAPGVEPRTSW